MKFPQYRKLSNEKSFYRIDDDRTFYEIQVIGKTSFLLKIEAKQYPEILRIQDMLNEMEPFEKSSIDEFHARYVTVVGK